MAKSSDSSGRQSKTRGVSLSESEAQLVDRFAALSGIGFTEQVRQNLMSRLPAAVALLEDMRASGMELDPAVIHDQVVYVQSEDERRELREDTFVSAAVQHAAAAGA